MPNGNGATAQRTKISLIRSIKVTKRNDTGAMNVKDTLRTLLGIRVERGMSPPGPKPQIGSNIVRDTFRLRLKYPISDDQWDWLTGKGWRTVDMRTNRRRYTCVPDKVLIKLLNSNDLEREVLHQRLVNAAVKHSERKKSSSKVGLRAKTVIRPPLQNTL